MNVLISGAGIAGPALAWFLAKTGARVNVVEKSHSLLTQGHNIDIEGSAIRVVEKMGLLGEVRRFNTTEKGTQFIDPKGHPFAPFPISKEHTASPTSELEILRGDLATIFYDATKDHPNITYSFGTSIRNIISNDQRAVRVELSNNAVHKYDLLVAADGQWSNVRNLCFPKESVQVVDKNMYVAYSTIPRLPSDNDWWNVYQALGSRIVTTRPDPHGTIRAMFTRMPCDATQRQAWLEASGSNRPAQQKLLRKEFAGAGWQTERLLDAMEEASDFYLQTVQQIKMTKWSNNRVVCIGDAGFASSPLSGRGTPLAIISAYVLAGELSELGSGEHPARALESYEKTLRPFVEEVQQIPIFIPAIAHPKTAWKRWLFGAFVSVVSKVVATSWYASKFGGVDDDDFPLPQYSVFDNEHSTHEKGI